MTKRKEKERRRDKIKRRRIVITSMLVLTIVASVIPAIGAILNQGNFIDDTNKTTENKTVETQQYYEDALLAYNDGQYDNALTYINQALEVSSNDTRTQYLELKGDILFNLNNYDEAIAIYQQAASLAGNSSSVLNKIANVYIIQEKYQEAIAPLSKILDTAEDYETLLLRAKVYYLNKQFELALLDYDKLVESAPANIDYRVGRLQVYTALDYAEKASQEIDEIMALDPDYNELNELQGDYAYQSNDFFKAIKSYTAAIANSPAAGLYIKRGDSYFQTGNYTAAAKDYLIYQQENQTDVDILNRLVSCYVQLNDTDNLKKTLTLLVQYYSSDLNNLYQLGYLHYIENDYSNAIKYWSLYEQDGGTQKDYYYLLALSYLNIEDNDSAADYFTKSIKSNQYTGISYFNRGNIYLNTGDYQNAISDFQAAYDLGEQRDYAKYNQGMAYMNLNKFRESTTAFKEVVAISSNQDLITKAKEWLSRYYVQ